MGNTFRALLALAFLATAAPAEAHPMGNFSISRYSGLTVEPESIEVRYLVDMAEIPTFQEIQESGIVPEAGHPGLDEYLARRAEELKAGLALELNGQRLVLRSLSRTARFSPGAGDLPTMKLGFVYRATAHARAVGLSQLDYRDGNFPDRAGWKEVVAEAAFGVGLAASSVPEQDRSRQLTDYPTDLMNSPPQTVQASLTFAVAPPPITASARSLPSAAPLAATPSLPLRAPLPSAALPPFATPLSAAPSPGAVAISPPSLPSAVTQSAARPRENLDAPIKEVSRSAVVIGREESPRPTVSLSVPAAEGAVLDLQPNRQAARGNRFTDLITSGPGGPGMLLFAALVAATLGAFHALEPGHGKTVVAAYLVGARGTARHAILLGLIVTASHTAGVYLLGLVTLYASRYVVPERIYPWLGALSGLAIAGLGFSLFLKRYAENPHARDTTDHDHSHHTHEGSDHYHASHHHPHDAGHHHRHRWGNHHHHHVPPSGTISLRALLVLGVTGGIVPCPAALVVLLSAVALRRVGFGLFLIVAFSVGLAGVLIGIGLLMVYARRLMARVEGSGPVITRWLPLTSSATITVLGVAIAAQALMAAGILTLRLG